MVRNWPPEFIPIALPLIACTIIGPAAVNITPEQDRQGGHINKEMTDLVLQRFAEYWGLGSVLVGEFVIDLDIQPFPSLTSFDIWLINI